MKHDFIDHFEDTKHKGRTCQYLRLFIPKEFIDMISCIRDQKHWYTVNQGKSNHIARIAHRFEIHIPFLFLHIISFVLDPEGHQQQPYKQNRRNTDQSITEEQEHLYINFTKDYYVMKKGEVFDYMSCIQSTNGNVTPIVTTVIGFERGSYLLQYKVESKTDPSIYRIYKKILIVE